MHAIRMDNPFACGAVDDEDGGACPPDRPRDDELSCDAAGCHGNYQFKDQPMGLMRDLLGSDGPSCYTCHGAEWED